MMNLREFLEQHENDYICISCRRWNEQRVKAGYEWLEYFGNDIDIYDLDFIDDDFPAGCYDCYIAIR